MKSMLLQTRTALIGAVANFLWLGLSSCSVKSKSSVESQRKESESVGGQTDALDASALRSGSPQLSAIWKLGFLENHENQVNDTKVELDLRGMSVASLLMPSSSSAMPTPTGVAPSDGVLDCVKDAISNGAIVKIDGPSASIDYTLPTTACPIPAGQVGQISSLHFVFAIRCLNGSTLSRFSGFNTSVFLNSPVVDFCYGTKTGVLFEMLKTVGSNSVSQSLNDRNKSLCTIDFSSKQPVLPETCQSISYTQQNPSP